ncbi:MAG: EscU/YscU/HrcU family type III secretion system export apparatus switch protein [Oscillospiraceae bacterium]|jgi:flagellar biosynthesis protein|nr:EscU/YscU/HrcU family type III secretion system export apparatus switch protein [Oscillospiraceae bacterium]
MAIRRKKVPPPREAVALQYDKDRDAAPRVVAAGRGATAERIVSKAEESGVPIHMDPELAHTLNLLSMGQEIPAELYLIVAQVLLFVTDIDAKIGR